jgi:hypothetical protein
VIEEEKRKVDAEAGNIRAKDHPGRDEAEEEEAEVVITCYGLESLFSHLQWRLTCVEMRLPILQ